jgi:hypothetical protein
MAATILGNISLGYQFLWNRLRQPAAVQLFVDADAEIPVDARHLLAALTELWVGQAPTLLLSIQSPPLLLDLLDHGDASAPWVQVPHAWLRDPALRRRLKPARLRGLKMVWRGQPGEQPDSELASFFHKRMISIAEGPAPLTSPVEAGQIYEGVASRALAEQCLYQHDAWALAGWPMEDVLRGYPQAPIQPARNAITRLIQAIDADASLEVLEHRLSAEPVLAYRFLRQVNSPGLGLRSEIDSIWRGLMVWGLSALKAWLQTQIPQASTDLNLQPVRMAIVTRAHVLERLLDAGEEVDLRREIYLCGLLSQIDLLLREPLATALRHLPLPERIEAGLLQHAGPYSPYLDIAAALESPRTRATHALCNLHQISMEDVNRALLRTLASTLAHPA